MPSIQPDLSNHKPYKILIMDDEKYIQTILKKILEKLGYSVELTANGEDAVERYKALMEDKAPVDLVLLDLTVPGGMGGKQASELILEIDPSAKIVISSGNTHDPLLSDYRANGLKGILPKPFRLNALKKIIEQILAQ
ncbi:MAG: response regulator [Pseudomonadota bacterium]